MAREHVVDIAPHLLPIEAALRRHDRHPSRGRRLEDAGRVPPGRRRATHGRDGSIWCLFDVRSPRKGALRTSSARRKRAGRTAGPAAGAARVAGPGPSATSVKLADWYFLKAAPWLKLGLSFSQWYPSVNSEYLRDARCVRTSGTPRSWRRTQSLRGPCRCAASSTASSRTPRRRRGPSRAGGNR